MKTLAYIIILASACIFALSTAFAQSYRLSPGNSLQLSGLMEDQQTLIISQVNTSPTSINFRWKKLDASVPEKWESSICDNLICYANLVESGAMSPLLPNDSSYILLHITPHVTYGEAVIRYLIWDSAFPSKIDTLTYTLIVSPNSIYERRIPNEDIALFPNPVSSSLTLTSASTSEMQYSIADLTGRILTSGAAYSQLTVDTQHYPSGLYVVTIASNKKHFTYQFIKL